MKEKIVIGSRGSDLALWQAHFVKSELESKENCDVEIKIIKTQGDIIQNVSFDKMEGKGFFTKEIEEALLNREIDVAVHSHKDLPTTHPDKLKIAAVSYRENPAELLLMRNESFEQKHTFFLKKNAIVGTSSGRRISQMNALRPDFEFKVLRGNVPTRINKLRNGEYDAIVLAAAGVHRLKLDIEDLVHYEMYPENIIPAPAQGVLALQIHEENTRVESLLSSFNNADVQQLIHAERDVLRRFDGGCQLALGSYAFKHENKYRLFSCWSPDKVSAPLYLRLRGNSLEGMSEKAYSVLSSAPEKLKQKHVYVTKNEDEAIKFNETLRTYCKDYTLSSHIQIKHLPSLKETALYTDYVIFTSKHAVESFFDQGNTLADTVNIISVGKVTAKSLIAHGFKAHIIPNKQSQEGIVEWIKQNDPKRNYTYISGNMGLTTIEESVEKVERINVYETTILPITDLQKNNLEEATDIVFTSPSNVTACKDLSINWAEKTIYAYGKITGQIIKEYFGVSPIVLQEPSADELISELIQH